jgi:cell wall-associated NlpC family hydrolase
VKRFRAKYVLGAMAALLLAVLIPVTATAGSAPENGSVERETPSVSSAAIETAIAFGQEQVGQSLYTGCSAGDYRMGAMPSEEMHFDGRGCGQSYIYVLRPGLKGFDCSGLIYKMFEHAGVDFPYTSSAAMAALPAVDKSQIQRGDLLVKPGSHVAMYLGVADGVPWVLEASPKQILEQNGIWRVAQGVLVSDGSSYLNNSGYGAHRVVGA